MRLAGGLGGDSRAAKESKKKLLAAALAAGLPAPVDERPPRYKAKHGADCEATAGHFLCGFRAHAREMGGCQQQDVFSGIWLAAAGFMDGILGITAFRMVSLLHLGKLCTLSSGQLG